MDQQSATGRPPLSAWKGENLRLTAFPSAPVSLRELNWWSEVVGENPETRTEKLHEGKLQEEGVFEHGKLMLNAELVRVDWYYSPLGRPVAPTPVSFPEALNPFLRLMNEWLGVGSIPPLNRLAFGAILLQPVESKQDGYRLLAKYLPYVTLDPESSSDFAYQINRPRHSISGIADLKINRLSRWSIASSVTVAQRITPQAVEHLVGPEYLSCRLELDINTAPDFEGELPPNDLALIFRELVKLGKEIAERGDNV